MPTQCGYQFLIRRKVKVKPSGMIARYSAMTNEPEDMRLMESENNNDHVNQIGQRVKKTKSISPFLIKKHVRTKLSEKLSRNSLKRKDSERQRNLGLGEHNEAFRSKIQPGDHIYSERKDDMYHHHGIYEGGKGDWVIHFQGPSKTQSAACPKCSYIHPKKGGRVRTCLDCFSNKQLCYIIRYQRQRSTAEWIDMDDSTWAHIVPGKGFYGYNSEKIYIELYLDNELYAHVNISKEDCSKNKVDFDHQIKLSRFSSSKSAEDVIYTASTCATKKYNLFRNNCEHFAVYCKTGKGRSIQVKKGLKILRKKLKSKQGKKLAGNSSRKKELINADEQRLLNQDHNDQIIDQHDQKMDNQRILVDQPETLMISGRNDIPTIDNGCEIEQVEEDSWHQHQQRSDENLVTAGDDQARSKEETAVETKAPGAVNTVNSASVTTDKDWEIDDDDENLPYQPSSCCLPCYRRGKQYLKLGEPKPRNAELCGFKENWRRLKAYFGDKAKFFKRV